MGLIVNNDNGLNGKVIRLGELMISWDEEAEEREDISAPAAPNAHKTDAKKATKQNKNK